MKLKLVEPILRGISGVKDLNSFEGRTFADYMAKTYHILRGVHAHNVKTSEPPSGFRQCIPKPDFKLDDWK